MIGLLEKYKIACPELAIFRKAFSVANAEFRDNHSQLFEIYLRMLPTEINTGTNDQPKISCSSTISIIAFRVVSHWTQLILLSPLTRKILID